MSVEQADVIVIGAGSAALEAAISAKESGAERVVILEKAPADESGGNARFSHTGFRFVHSGAAEVKDFIPTVDPARFARMHIPPYTHQQFRADLDRVTQNRIDPDLAEAFVANSNAAVHWMREIGVQWEHEKPVVEINGKLFFEPGINIHPVGGGLGMLKSLRDIALKKGCEIRYESRVADVLGNERAIEGVAVSSPDKIYDLAAKAVIVASGGFQANAEMRARYLGANADLMKVRGSKHNTGEVLMKVLGLGAAAAGHWQGAHMTPIDAQAPAVETPARPDGHGNTMNRYDYNLGITVNAGGVRFYDEGEDKVSYTYAKTGREVLQQPGSLAYQIYDQKGLRLFRHGSDMPATKEDAPTIAELARKLGIEPEVLVHTVAQYNAACPKTPPFDPSKPDGRATVGLTPRKSHWAEPLVEAPFRAYPITAGITFTFGGLRIDDSARVLNTSLTPIRGLFATGDVIGLFFHNYPSCSGQTRNAVFSWIAGKQAAAIS